MISLNSEKQILMNRFYSLLQFKLESMDGLYHREIIARSFSLLSMNWPNL